MALRNQSGDDRRAQQGQTPRARRGGHQRALNVAAHASTCADRAPGHHATVDPTCVRPCCDVWSKVACARIRNEEARDLIRMNKTKRRTGTGTALDSTWGCSFKRVTAERPAESGADLLLWGPAPLRYIDQRFWRMRCAGRDAGAQAQSLGSHWAVFTRALVPETAA